MNIAELDELSLRVSNPHRTVAGMLAVQEEEEKEDADDDTPRSQIRTDFETPQEGLRASVAKDADKR